MLTASMYRVARVPCVCPHALSPQTVSILGHLSKELEGQRQSTLLAMGVSMA